MMKRRAFRQFVPFSLMAIVFLPMIVTSSEPSMPPGHCYGAWGFVVSTSGGYVMDNTVALFGRGGDMPSEWIRLDACCGEGNGIDITDEKGRFRVSACDWFKLDSLAVAVVRPDTTILSAPIRTSDLHVTVDEVPFTEDGFFCDDTEWRVENYLHESADSVIIMVP